jgi:8-oxo-dGTP diphosphatase
MIKPVDWTAPAEIVVGFVVRGGRFLILPREGDPGLAGTWELPGGKVGPNEDHETALAREVLEETGLAVEVGERICDLCHVYPDRRVALHAYLCTPVAAAPASVDAASSVSAGDSSARWVTVDEYRALSIPAGNPPLIDAFAWKVAGP